jgi:hypothetical protein
MSFEDLPARAAAGCRIRQGARVIGHGLGRDEFGTFLDLVLPLVGQANGSVIIGRGRPRGTRPTDSDRAWHEQAIHSCREHGVRLLGFHLATCDGVLALPEPLQHAS